jgi:hypothetical protein
MVRMLASALLLLAAATSAAQTCGFEWVNPAPPEVALQAVTHGGGRYVAVGLDGAAVASSDGATWRAGDTGVTYGLGAVTYGNGLYVAVGQGSSMAAVVLTSPDGLEWTQRWFDPDRRLNDVAWCGGRFVAVGYDAHQEVLTSADGISWTPQPVGFSAGQIESNGALCLAVGDSTQATADGLHWEVRGPAPEWPQDLAWDGTQFLLLPYGVVPALVLASIDGSSWLESSDVGCPAGTCWPVAVAGGPGVVVEAEQRCISTRRRSVGG